MGLTQAQEVQDLALRREAEKGILLTSVDKMVRWARKSSVWPATFGLACCAIEMMSTTDSRYDLARFGSEVFRASPRQADLMIVAGRVSQKMAPVLRTIWEQMPEPKWVISMGACASSGGVFDNYAIVQGVDQVVPVDVYAPGCPPTPETLMHAILTLHEKVRTGAIARRPGRDAALVHPLAHDEGSSTDDATAGERPGEAWTPDRPDAVRLGTPHRNPVIARSVGEPL